MGKRIRRDLTPLQRSYALHRAMGYPQTTAARLAGYADTGSGGIRVVASRTERHPAVRQLVEDFADADTYRALRAFLRTGEIEPAERDRLLEWRGTPRHTKARLLKAAVMASKMFQVGEYSGAGNILDPEIVGADPSEMLS